jgi:hypothetical protein
LPAKVPKQQKGKESRSPTPSLQTLEKHRLHTTDRFGDEITKKQRNTLCIAFQNIGGLPLNKNDIKEENLRSGINNWNFDIFGLLETNIDWQRQSENNKLWHRTREWWEHLHISHSHNTTCPPIEDKQFGVTAVFTINDSAHRVTAKGKDSSNLGRWSWTKLQGKNDHNLTILVAYRPNPPSAGVMGVYSQHSKYFNYVNRDVFPREAFIIDLRDEILQLQETGTHLIIMLDGNEDMRSGHLSKALTSLHLREAILQKHGNTTPSTYRRNTKDVPIDGIWISQSLYILKGGYLDFDEVIFGTDHHTLWVDISFTSAFGHTGTPPIVRLSAQRLNNRNPKVRNKFNALRKEYARKSFLTTRTTQLELSIQGEMNSAQIREYETIDRLRRQHIKMAENRCRKFRCGNIPYSTTIQEARNKIEA